MIPTNRPPWKGNSENDTPQQDPENSLRLQAQMLDHIGQAVIATNLAGRVIYANRAACTVYRWPHGEVIGAHILEVMTPLAMGEHTDEIIGCLERCDPWNGEIIVRRHDTTIFPVTLNSAPVFDSTGKIVGLIGISTDISERKRNEHQWTVLSRLGRGLNSAQNPRDAAMLIVEACDAIFGWDAAIVQHYDAANDLLSSILTIDIIDGKKAPYDESGTWTPSPRTRKVLKEGPLLILRTADDKPEPNVQMFGTTTKISRSIMMVPIRNGPDIIGALSIQSYRTNAYTNADLELFQMFADYGAGALNRISAEEQRRGAEQLLAEQAALLDIAHDGIVARDLEDKIVYWNKGAENSYGWTAREMLGKKSIDIHADKSKFAEAFTCVAKNGEWSGEIPQMAKDGRTLTMQVRWTLVRDGDGKPKAILSINTDITEKKKLEGQFLRTQRIESIGTLASGIAHDLNNVLAPILMAVPMLRESTENTKQRHILDTLEKSSQRGADLVRQVLIFARGVEGKRSAVNAARSPKSRTKSSTTPSRKTSNTSSIPTKTFGPSKPTRLRSSRS